jgi:acylphosphatase
MRLHVLVRGRVQGVGFRWHVREIARQLGLAGWVRNRTDGSVEVAADGAAPALEQLRDALRRGPSGASVTAVDDVEDRSATDGSELARPFTILR